MKTFRRYHGYDYSRGAFLFLTIATSPRKALFGHVEERGVVLNPLGKAVAEAVRHVALKGKGVMPCTQVLMPDHLHLRVYLARGLERPLDTLGQFVANFKRYTNLLARRHGAATGPIWQAGYHSLVCSQRRMVDDVDRYIGNNPDKWWLMHCHPEVLRVREPIDIPQFGHDGFWRAVGDLALLDDKLLGLRVSQKVPASDFPALAARIGDASKQGFTVISTFVSPGERFVLEALAADPLAKMVRVVPKPVVAPYRPSGQEPPLFATGRLLLLAPSSVPERLERAGLLRMNEALAAAAESSPGGLAVYAVYEGGAMRLKRVRVQGLARCARHILALKTPDSQQPAPPDSQQPVPLATPDSPQPEPPTPPPTPPDSPPHTAPAAPVFSAQGYGERSEPIPAHRTLCTSP